MYGQLDGKVNPYSQSPTPTLAKPVISYSGSTSFCQGSSLELSAPAGFSAYIWSNGATTQKITVKTNGQYSVKVKNEAGLTSPSSDAITITVKALPAKPVVASTS